MPFELGTTKNGICILLKDLNKDSIEIIDNSKNSIKQQQFFTQQIQFNSSIIQSEVEVIVGEDNMNTDKNVSTQSCLFT